VAQLHARYMMMINICAPTDEREEEKKENFYAKLERVYDMDPSIDVKTVLGDKNDNIGQEREYYAIIGKHGLHKTSIGNGKLLIGFYRREECVHEINPTLTKR
jgi:hypothetical protein